ncbi:hypothetical protein [Ruegeria atlantica]|uniref:hypothetical protein n=1 Tax=Ruegeria atlantica TaxID=81569 RepID=UPI0024944C86|nr:hypothetical protein [Ruegeria atlantica]
MKNRTYLIQFAASALLSFVAANAVIAKEVRFWDMPTGCSWTVEYSNGNTWVNTFDGQRSGKYIVTTKDKSGNKNRVKTTEYDKEGLMTQRTWANGKWEMFEPHSCFGVPGKCSYTYRNADGVVSQTTSKTTVVGPTRYRVKARSGDAGTYSVDTVTTTHFGLALSSRNKNFWAKITEFRNCGIAAS